MADGPFTLAIDIGGTGLKATVLDAAGAAIHDRVRTPTTYPCPPGKLVDDLVALVAPLPAHDRVSVGFPGVVRNGHIWTAATFESEHGLGSERTDELIEAWHDFDLAGALGERLAKPTRVANDADVQGAGAVAGTGIELVITLGTGVGSSVFRNGKLALHLEVAHHPVSKDRTYNEYLGEAARKDIGVGKWNERVRKALRHLDVLVAPDSILVGGGNAKRLVGDLDAKIRVVDNSEGLLGGIRLWDSDWPL